MKSSFLGTALAMGILLLQTGAAHADSFSIQQGETAGTLDFTFNGGPGGVAAELIGYFASAGLTPEVSDGNTSYQDGLLHGWKSTVPVTFYTFFMTVQASEISILNLQASFSPNGNPIASSTPQGTVNAPDGASALLYDLMSKSGIQPQAGDASKTLYGKNVICWGYHGYPVGQTQLNPTCRITVF